MLTFKFIVNLNIRFVALRYIKYIYISNRAKKRQNVNISHRNLDFF